METTGSIMHEKLYNDQMVQVYRSALNAAAPASINCAMELGILDAIDKVGGEGLRPVSFQQLMEAMADVISPAKVPHIPRLLRLLVQLNFLASSSRTDGSDDVTKGTEEDSDVGYLLTPFSQLLLKKNSMTIGVEKYYMYCIDPTFSPWLGLSEWFRRDDSTTPFEVAHGKPVWDFLKENPERGHGFNEAMSNESRLVMDFVVRECADVFHGIRSLVDVGGGIGTASMAIAKAFPNIKCSVLDLPHVVAHASSLEVPKNHIDFGTTATPNQLHFIAGDMFQHVPSADAVLLKSILHNWSDESCVKLLKRCKESISTTNGKLIIIEPVLDLASSNPKLKEAQLFVDLLMMSLVAAKERDPQEWHNILIEAVGFSSFKIKHVVGIQYLIEVYP